MRKQINRKVRVSLSMKKMLIICLSAALTAALPVVAGAEEGTDLEDEYAAEVSEETFEAGAESFEEDLWEVETLAEEDLEEDISYFTDEPEDDENEEIILFDEEDFFTEIQEDQLPETDSDEFTDEEPLFIVEPEEFEDEQDQENDLIYSGECGKKEGTVFWELDEEGTLHIFGQGSMEDWEKADDVPWYPVAGDIYALDIQKGVTHIGSYAFSGCSGLTSVRVG